MAKRGPLEHTHSLVDPVRYKDVRENTDRQSVTDWKYVGREKGKEE